MNALLEAYLSKKFELFEKTLQKDLSLIQS